MRRRIDELRQDDRVLDEQAVRQLYRGHIAGKLRRVVENCRIRRVGSDEIVANVTISLGAACRLPGESEQQLIARADTALYQAKQQGRNRVTLAAACARGNLSARVDTPHSVGRMRDFLRE